MKVTSEDPAQQELMGKLIGELQVMFSEFAKKTGAAIDSIHFNPMFSWVEGKTEKPECGFIEIKTVKVSDTTGYYEYYENGSLKKVERLA